jgi:hypothetical protein
MNVANLQLEGLLVAVAELLRELEAEGSLDRSRIEGALLATEARILSDEQRMGQLSASERDSCLFPCRFLAAALGDGAPFSALTKHVGETKDEVPTDAVTRALLEKP